ncbi:MAG: leucine-rich repeat domain-containing protein [Bacteroidales bacterium]|nr:leucine-rich repeat domain-containing protein [Bacteroidales bacterium]
MVCSTKPTSNKSITIPSNVTIKNKTFNVTSVGENAFSSCDYITSVTLPNTLTTIGRLAFYGCKGLSSINLPENLTSIGNAAFMYCNKIISVVIPEGVTVINYQTFSDCSTLKTVKLSSNCTKIDNRAFSYCYALENIEIPNGVTYIGDYSFYGAAFTEVVIPHSVTTLGDFVFSGCSKLTKLTIGNGVKTINSNVIETYNSPLAKLTIGSSVTNIGLNLGYCSELTEIHSLALQPPTLAYSLNKNTTVYVPYDGDGYHKYVNATYWKDCTIVEGGAIGQLPVGAKLMSDNICYKVIVEGKEVSVTSLPSGKYTGVVVIPSTIIHSGITYSVTEIGMAAFYDCSNLTNVEIPNSIKEIVGADYYYKGAFSTCPNLKTVTFAENSQLTHIGSFAFHGCSNLTSINIPKNVTRIEGAAFTQCTKLKSVTFEEDSKLTFIQGFSYNTSLTSIEIPASVTELGASAFNGCTNLQSVKFGEGSQLTTIGNNAFYDCNKINTITFNALTPPSVGSYSFTNYNTFLNVPEESILTYRNDDFWGKFNYNNVHLINGIYYTTVNDNAIVTYKNKSYGNYSGDVVIPNTITINGINYNVTYIDEHAFDGCSNLTCVVIPNSIKSIADYAFNNCSKLATVTFEDDSQLETIGDYAFYKCSILTSIGIPNSVTEIGASAFYNCSSLTSVYIPSEVASIYNAAFSGCTNLKEIICFNITPSTITNNVFSGIMSDAKIYVPSVSLYNYKTQWSSYSNKIVGMPTYTENGWTSEPTAEDNVAVNYPLVISGNTRANDILTVNTIGICNNGSLTIKDGGQLVCNRASGSIIVEKEIEGYANQDGNSWHTIASPLKGEIDLSASSVNNIFNNQYDLYRYDEPTFTWQNYKNSANNGFTNLEAGRGYLYANSEDVTLSFAGNINTNDVSYNLTKEGEMLNGFHLIGNPFTHNIKLENNNQIAQGYYTLSNEGAWGVMLGFDEPVKPCQGVLVKALEEGTLVIKNEMPQAVRSQQSTDNGQQSLGITVANGKYSDKAFVVFGKGAGLDKINHQNENIPMLYIPVDGVDYAIAAMDKNFNEIPVSFEAMTMGEYTISLSQENCEFTELYLLDKQTGMTVNILEDDYTFMATSNDSPERFVLLKDNSQQTTDNSPWVYLNNGDIVISNIEGNAEVNIFDAMGRCVYQGECREAANRIRIDGYSAGVYIIQKIDDNGIDVQKIIL